MLKQKKKYGLQVCTLHKYLVMSRTDFFVLSDWYGGHVGAHETGVL